MLSPMMVLLQGEPGSGVDSYMFDLETLAALDALIKTPRPIDPRRQEMKIIASLL
jgi:hypothetical protein